MPEQPRAPPNRDVARPVANLGNTCYMNAVLQALAHAPELCLAMDVEPHHATCPIYAENARCRAAMSPSSSPLGGYDDEEEDDVKPTRKSRRSNSSRKNASGNGSGSNNNNGASSSSNIYGDGRKFCTLCEVERHLRRVHTPSPTKDKPVSPSTFVHGFIQHVAPMFKLGVQEDSHEFLRLLIDAMQRSCKDARPSLEANGDDGDASPATTSPQRARTRVKQEDDGNGNDANAAAATSAAAAEEAKKDAEYPFQLFRGTIDSQVTCGNCNATSSTLDPIEDIGLEVSQNPDVRFGLTDVSSAFQRFAKIEQLDYGYKCEKCGKVGKATKQSRLASIPPILTLHLKRFRYGDNKAGSMVGSAPTRRSGRSSEIDLLTGRSGSAKVEGHAKFEPIIDLKPYLTPGLQSKHSNLLCRLFSVIVHAGKNSHSGHYISYVRNVAKNEWWKMDDARVTLASFQEVMNAEAYMLFYRVVDHPFAQHVRSESKKLEDAFKIADLPDHNIAPTSDKSSDDHAAAVAAAAAAATATATVDRNANGAASESTAAKPQSSRAVTVKTEDSASSSSRAATTDPSASKQQQQLQPQRNPMPTRREVETSRRSHNSRKRKAPEFTCGDDWAKSKTTLPRAIFHRFRDIEHCISDFVEFRPEFVKMITEQASRRSAQVGHGPSSGISPDDDFTDESISNIKRILKNLFCALEEQQKLEGGSLFPKNTRRPKVIKQEASSMPPPSSTAVATTNTATAAASSSASSSIGRVANIVVADNADLL